mgnify:CR=1 FL=1
MMIVCNVWAGQRITKDRDEFADLVWPLDVSKARVAQWLNAPISDRNRRNPRSASVPARTASRHALYRFNENEKSG